MRLDRRSDAWAEDLDLALIARLDRDGRILVVAGADLDALDGRQRKNVGALDLDRILVALLVDEIEIGQRVERRQIRRIAGEIFGRIGDDDRLALVGLVEDVRPGGLHPILAGRGREGVADEGEGNIGEGVDHAAVADELRGRRERDERRHAAGRERDRNRDRELALVGRLRPSGDRAVAVGDELQFSAAPERRAVQDLQPSRQDRRRLLLAVEDRRERDAERPAVGLQQGIIAGAEQRRRIDAGRIEARAILGVGQKVIDDLGRIGVDPVRAGAGEDAENLEVVVADRCGVAGSCCGPRRSGLAASRRARRRRPRALLLFDPHTASERLTCWTSVISARLANEIPSFARRMARLRSRRTYDTHLARGSDGLRGTHTAYR